MAKLKNASIILFLFNTLISQNKINLSIVLCLNDLPFVFALTINDSEHIFHIFRYLHISKTTLLINMVILSAKNKLLA